MSREPAPDLDHWARVVIDAAKEVHQTFGPGFLEAVYEEALCIELALRDVPFERQLSVALEYKGRAVGNARIDLLVGGCLVVELKAVEIINPIHVSQMLSYLRATRSMLGLLINFNVRFILQGTRRVILSDLQ